MLDAFTSRKAINFDLNDNLLKANYPSCSYKNGWRDISYFLKKSGFIHRQYSGYVSQDVIQYTKVNDIIRKMSDEFPWLKRCIMEFDVTAVLEEYSLMDFFKEQLLIENSEIKLELEIINQ